MEEEKLWWKPLEKLERLTVDEMHKKYDGLCVFFCMTEVDDKWNVISGVPYAVSNKDGYIDHDWSHGFVRDHGGGSFGSGNYVQEKYPTIKGVTGCAG